MRHANVVKAIVAAAIIGAAAFVIIKDEPAPPTGDINAIEPVPKQDAP
ncbi:hypothetical protein C8D92_11058 [Tamilnaduibacter salinus]|uniref:Uncharacterized protein n=1 Tax=Tamilnaduibacter salinus TaxID=1484056 RepID=A0A2U1CTP1_9GAMM|nr:hypothetical protein [Tamilnaduibacter salinus]PVY70028.1 hypothetical protein C8D92_11058 [Tamilnaduibacter salinus]